MNERGNGRGDNRRGPPQSPIIIKWAKIPLGWNPYFPWYLMIPLMMVPIIPMDTNKKLLNYVEYTKISNHDAHVHVFSKTSKLMESPMRP